MSESKKVLKRISEMVDNIIVNTEDEIEVTEGSKVSKPTGTKKKPADKVGARDKLDKVMKAMKDPKKGPAMAAVMYKYLSDNDLLDGLSD